MSPVSEARRQAGEIIAQHASSIAEEWREAVRKDQEIGGDDRLPDLLLTNQVPALLADIAQALAGGDDAALSDLSIMRRRRGLRFGKLRGLARYDASELYREFKHLRHAIWRLLRQELDAGRGDAFEVMLAVDQYLDEVIGASLRGFFETSERISRDSSDTPRVTTKEMEALKRSPADEPPGGNKK
ncbi:MAG: RsbRD N-terminal domain-containing protein [Gemmatimonadales bacterium]